MGCREDVGGNPLAAAQVAPGKAGLAGRRLDPGHQRHMIEPSRGKLRFEVAQIRDVGRIAVEVAGHWSIAKWMVIRPKGAVARNRPSHPPVVDVTIKLGRIHRNAARQR